MDVSDAIIRRTWDETPRFKGVVLEVSAQTAQAYQRAGQFVEVDLPGSEPATLAIASNPGEARAFELLVGDPARSRGDWVEGRRIVIRGPGGPGFPAVNDEGGVPQDVLLFAQGSALSALRPVIDGLRRARAQYGRVKLYVGARTPADFPYASEYGPWRADGIEVIPSVSRPWVQDRFRADPGMLAHAVALVCGTERMMDDVTAVLVSAGLPETRIGRNWWGE